MNKQLEAAAEKFCNDNYASEREVYLFTMAFKAGAEWQQSQLSQQLSEDELKAIAEQKYPLPKYHEREREAMFKGLKYPLNRSGWISVETPPEDSIEVIGFSEKWVHPDFNTNGTRICFINEGEWMSAKWDNDQDSWHTHAKWCCETNGGIDFNPTLWQPLPEKPII